MASEVSSDLKSDALHFHREPRPGKLEIQPTKPLGNQRDLALAYSPGVAVACEAIVADPAEAANLTARGNLVAVITNGTAVLGLGAIGPLAAKPVMEGKAVLFKKFAGIDVFDIEIAENDLDKLVDIIVALEPTFGGINLEDIKAPECFEVEEKLPRRAWRFRSSTTTSTARRSSSRRAVLNALKMAGKDIERGEDRRLGRRRAGARLRSICWSRSARGARISSSATSKAWSTRAATKLMDRWTGALCAARPRRATLADVIDGADIFLGLSARRRAEAGMLKRMARDPIDPGAGQSDARDHAGAAPRPAARRDDRTGRSRLSEPGQQRPVLPLHLPRRARCRRDDDQRGDEARRVEAIADLAREAPSEVVGARLWRRGAAVRPRLR